MKLRFCFSRQRSQIKLSDIYIRIRLGIGVIASNFAVLPSGQDIFQANIFIQTVAIYCIKI